MNYLYSSHLKNTIWLTAFSATVTVLALSDVNKNCIAKNNGTISKDYLLGSWYKVYKFILFGPYLTCTCPNVTFTIPTEEQLKEYREKVSSVDLPHEIDDDAVLADTAYVKGLLLGGSEAKTYIVDPKSGLITLDGYEVQVYKRINDKYMLHWQCSLRGHVKWLLTRDPKAPLEEIQKVIMDTPDITCKTNAVRYCNNC